jgi:hypothetical protein
MDRHDAQDHSGMDDVVFETSANTSTLKSRSKKTLESEAHVGASCGVSGYWMLILIH